MPRAGIIINGTKLAKVEVFYLGSFMCNNCSLEKGICRLSECSLPKNSLWQWFSIRFAARTLCEGKIILEPFVPITRIAGENPRIVCS